MVYLERKENKVDNKKMEVKKKSIWFHSPKMYDSYDTYKKMRRYREEWKGVSIVNTDIYEKGL